MKKPGIIKVRHLFPQLYSELLELLQKLSPDEWNYSTSSSKWAVKDIVSHQIVRLLYLLLISFGFLMITGCNPHSSIMLSNDASLKKLNDMVKERSVRVTTTDSIYTGNNIIIKRDSTIVENIYTKPKVIPFSSMRSINYTTNIQPLDGFIELKNNQVIQAEKGISGIQII